MQNIIDRAKAVSNLSGAEYLSYISTSLKIRELPKEDLSLIFGGIFTRIIALCGIKEALDRHIKEDIRNLICFKYNHLCFEEIEYAFQLERYGVLKPKTEHYQLFDAVFVSTILDKYIRWRHRLIQLHKSSINKCEKSLKPEDKQQDIRLFFKILKQDFSAYKLKKAYLPRHLLYKQLFELKLLPYHSFEYKTSVEQRAKSLIKDKGYNLRLICMSIVVEDAYKNFITNNIDISQYEQRYYQKHKRVQNQEQ